MIVGAVDGKALGHGGGVEVGVGAKQRQRRDLGMHLKGRRELYRLTTVLVSRK